ncbi:MAG: DUF1835 domain-containing protein [Flavobacteriaceae bacterium]|nr:DUF1835 domain-containing protein [Flavobacteriaceae bacterium]
MMSRSVHILNGDSISFLLKESGLTGDIIVWREMLCDGPLVNNVGSDDFWIQRYKFFEQELQIEKLEYYEKTIKELVAIEDLSMYNEVVLWFEYDLFCQINLLALCSYLLKHYKKDISYYLVCVGKEKERIGWQTLGDYSPNEYLSLYENKVKISRNDLIYADQCWKLFVDANKEDLESFNFNKNRKFQYLDIAIKQYLKNRSKTNGLDQIGLKILLVIDSKKRTESDIIRELLHWQRKETVNGFGDIQYQTRLKDLNDYYVINNNIYSLTKKGKEALA